MDSKKIIIVFHGLGATNDNLVPVLDFAVDYHKYFFQAPLRKMHAFADQECTSWYTWEENFELSQNNLEEMQELFNQISLVLTDNGHSDLSEMHALGFSQGGVMALTAAQRWELRSIALLSTFYNSNFIPSLNLHKTHIFVSMSESDQIVNSGLSSKMTKDLSPEALSIHICEDRSMGHSISELVKQRYQNFLTSQKN
jgi:predicted esterase